VQYVLGVNGMEKKVEVRKEKEEAEKVFKGIRLYFTG